jgi:hypothetical protein
VHGLQPLHGKGPHTLPWAGLRTARGKITYVIFPNRLKYCVIFIVYTQSTNMTAGRGLENRNLAHTYANIMAHPSSWYQLFAFVNLQKREAPEGFELLQSAPNLPTSHDCPVAKQREDPQRKTQNGCRKKKTIVGKNNKQSSIQ